MRGVSAGGEEAGKCEVDQQGVYMASTGQARSKSLA